MCGDDFQVEKRVMMPYVASADEAGEPVFFYYRERIIKRNAGFLWEGAVHETISVRGKVQYLEGRIFHRKEKQEDMWKLWKT